MTTTTATATQERELMSRLGKICYILHTAQVQAEGLDPNTRHTPILNYFNHLSTSPVRVLPRLIVRYLSNHVSRIGLDSQLNQEFERAMTVDGEAFPFHLLPSRVSSAGEAAFISSFAQARLLFDKDN